MGQCKAALRGEESRAHNARSRALKEQQIQEKEPKWYNAALEKMVKEMESKKRKVEVENLEEDNLRSNIGSSSSSGHWKGRGRGAREDCEVLAARRETLGRCRWIEEVGDI